MLRSEGFTTAGQPAEIAPINGWIVSNNGALKGLERRGEITNKVSMSCVCLPNNENWTTGLFDEDRIQSREHGMRFRTQIHVRRPLL